MSVVEFVKSKYKNSLFVNVNAKLMYKEDGYFEVSQFKLNSEGVVPLLKLDT